jgi:glutathione peroxidase
MAGLQVLEEQFSAQGFHMLGFLSNDFGNQGGDPGQVDQCTSDHGVTFQQFEIEHVLDPDGSGPQTARPVFDWLLAQPEPGPATSIAPTWNFHKYLISRDGQLVAHWPSAVYPGDDPNNPNDSFATSEIVMAIEAELAK